MADPEHRLGIDFGTSTTVAALAGPDGVRPLLFDGSPLLSSAVLATPDGTLRTGADAERSAAAAPAAFEPNPKRRIDDGTVWLGEREVPVAELVAAALGRVAAEARRVAGGPPGAVVLTHPASWQRSRRGLLAAAAERAGLGDVTLVAEPVAAAAWFVHVLRRRLPHGRSLVVYDLGAGTFDVSVVGRTEDGFTVLAKAGLDDVGGLDLDALLVAHARKQTGGDAAWQRLDWPETADDRAARQRLWREARAAKELLTRHANADLRVPLLEMNAHVTREEFEELARPLLDRTARLTRDTVRAAEVPPEQVAGVLLVGGASRVPLAATLLHQTLGMAPTALDHPELVVAEGALSAADPPPAAVPDKPIASARSVEVPEQTARQFQPGRAMLWALGLGAAVVGAFGVFGTSDGFLVMHDGVDAPFTLMTLPLLLGLVPLLAATGVAGLRRPTAVDALACAAVAAAGSTAVQAVGPLVTYRAATAAATYRNELIILWITAAVGLAVIGMALWWTARADAVAPLTGRRGWLKASGWLAAGVGGGLAMQTFTFTSTAFELMAGPDNQRLTAFNLMAYHLSQTATIAGFLLAGLALRPLLDRHARARRRLRPVAAALVALGGAVTLLRGLYEAQMPRGADWDRTFWHTPLAATFNLDPARGGPLADAWHTWIRWVFLGVVATLVLAVLARGRPAARA